MLHQELPRIEFHAARRLGALARAGVDRSASALTVALLLLLVGQSLLAGVAVLGGLAGGALAYRKRAASPAVGRAACRSARIIRSSAPRWG